jgi:hypothetical protein
MKKHVLLILTFVVLTLAGQRANAQWSLFSDLFSQLDNEVYNQYFNNLQELDNWNVDHVQGNDVLKDLYKNVKKGKPGGNLNDPFLDDIADGFDSLLNRIPGIDASESDKDALIGETLRIQDIFNTNSADLGDLSNKYKKELSFDSTYWTFQIIDFDNITKGHYEILQDTLNMIADPDLPQGPNDFPKLIDKAFNGTVFPDLELAFGTQDANLQYWGYGYSAKANVFRLGSVPRFNKPSITICHGEKLRLPIEPRWHVEGSWISQNKRPNGNGGRSNEKVVNNNRKGIQPLLLSGDYAMMATPDIGKWGKTTFKIITSLGMEFGVYAPAHRDFAPQRTSGNKGYTTGYGPQVGAGFTMTTGSLVIYSLTTIAHGNTYCPGEPSPYRYNSRRFEAGMRFGNIANVRYSKGWVSWQENDNRLANIRNQITMGIILKTLNK